MKKVVLLLLTLCCLLANGIAQVIENPSFRVRKKDFMTITKIERTAEHTLLYVHVLQTPKERMIVLEQAYLKDVATGEKYYTQGIDGWKFGFNEMPESGEVDFVLTFPAIPKSVKEVDWRWREDKPFTLDIYGISLEKSKGDSKALSRWKKEYPQASEKEMKKAGEAFDSKYIFKTDTAYFSGVIDHYDPELLGMKTGIIHYNNLFTGESLVKTVTIQPDGRFKENILLNAPGQFHLLLNRNVIPFYIEPGAHLSMYIDWEDVLHNNRNYKPTAKLEHIQYSGALAKVNVQLQMFPKIGFGNPSERPKDMTPNQYKVEIDKLAEKWQIGEDMLPKVKQLFRSEVSAAKVMTLVEFLKYKSIQEKEDENNTILKTMPSIDYFEDIKTALLSDLVLMNSSQISGMMYAFYYYNLLADVRRSLGIEAIRVENPHLEETAEEVFVLRKFLGTEEVPFWWQTMITRSACNRELFSIKDRLEAESFVTSLCNLYVKYPCLQEAIKNEFAERYAEEKVRVLLEGKGKDILLKLTESFRGKIVFIDFWATSCGPCRKVIESEGMKSYVMNIEKANLFNLYT